MKINSFTFKQTHQDLHGIQKGVIYNIPEVLCLVGRNGSGKSRIIEIFKNEILVNATSLALSQQLNISPLRLPDAAHFSKDQIKRIEAISAIRYKNTIEKRPLDANTSELLKFFEKTITSNSATVDQYENLNSTLSKALKLYLRPIDYSTLKRFNTSRNPSIKFRQPKIDELTVRKVSNFPQLNPIVALLKGNNTTSIDEIETINQYGLQYLTDLVQVLAAAKLQLHETPEIYQSSEEFKLFTKFRSLVSAMLRKNIDFIVDSSNLEIQADETISGLRGILQIDKRNFIFNQLSEGEKVLFGFAVLFFILEVNSNISIRDCIIIIDEPETHLHPEVQVLLISRLRDLIAKRGQLIIATHSINIISSLRPHEIFYIERGIIHHPSSKNISKTIEDLYGIGEVYDQFIKFIREEEEWSFRNFIGHCFIEPDIITTLKKDDPQFSLFKESIRNGISPHILDFGAGAGRLAQGILESIQSNKVAYSAFNPTNEYNDLLKGLGASKVYNKLESLPTASFDYVVMCNVLHEIDVSQMIYELDIVIRSLKESGYLIILEDKLLSKGEMPNEVGFLVFGEKELKQLFCSSPVTIIQHPDKRYKDRLLCAVMSKQNLRKPNAGSLKGALSILNSISFGKILDIKREKIAFDNLTEKGRVYGFWSQQYINSQVALDKINSNP